MHCYWYYCDYISLCLYITTDCDCILRLQYYIYYQCTFLTFLRDMVNPTIIIWIKYLMIQNKNQSILYTFTQITYIWPVAGKRTFQFCVFNRASTFPNWFNRVSDTLIQKLLAETIIMFIIFWDLLTAEQIFFSPQVKQGVNISNELVYTSCLMRCRTT